MWQRIYIQNVTYDAGRQDSAYLAGYKDFFDLP
jgi:hypothetical protein